jgi:uncharacterized protein YdeI (BOF family)
MKAFLTLALVIAGTPALANVTEISALQVGTNATISGVVERITDEDEFRLADSSGSVLVYIGSNIVPFNVGETITIEGIVDRDFGVLEVYAREATRADGSTLVFDHRDD